MSYTDLLQSYQDRLSSMVQNEESIGDYLLNKSQEKINSYLEQVGIPGQVGGVLDQVGILANNSAVKTLVEKSGLKGVVDEQLETLNRTVGDLKGQIKTFGEKASAAIDRQVSNAQDAARPLVERSQELINVGRQAEAQAREGVEAVRQIPGQAEQAIGQARQQAEGVVGQARGAAEEAVGQARAAGEEAFGQARSTIQNLTEGTQAAAENVLNSVTQRLSPEYLQNLTDDELKNAFKQVASRKQALEEQFQTSELPNREEVFSQLKEETRAERTAYLNEAERRGLYQREQPQATVQQPETEGVVAEPNVRPSQVARGEPQFESPSQQLPQIPRQEPEAPSPPAQQQPEAQRPSPPSEIEPAEEGEKVAEEGEEVSNVAQKVEDVASTTAKVGQGLEETTGELPGIGEIGEVFGALLQIGSLIASAFKPHEDVQTITTPISGFGFGANNQFGVGGTSIV